MIYRGYPHGHGTPPKKLDHVCSQAATRSLPFCVEAVGNYNSATVKTLDLHQAKLENPQF